MIPSLALAGVTIVVLTHVPSMGVAQSSELLWDGDDDTVQVGPEGPLPVPMFDFWAICPECAVVPPWLLNPGRIPPANFDGNFEDLETRHLDTDPRQQPEEGEKP